MEEGWETEWFPRSESDGVGGLIVRNYLETELYSDNVESLVFAATPHQGSIGYLEKMKTGKLTFQTSWERVWFEDREVPQLMREIIAIEHPWYQMNAEDPAYQSIKDLQEYSVIPDLEGREEDAESPIKNLPIYNIRPAGNNDAPFASPISIGASNASSAWNYTYGPLDVQIQLDEGVYLNGYRGRGDGYEPVSQYRFEQGEEITTREHRIDVINDRLGWILDHWGLERVTLTKSEYVGRPDAIGLKVRGEAKDVEIEWTAPEYENQQVVTDEESMYIFTSGGRRLTNYQDQVNVRITSHDKQSVFIRHILGIEHRFQNRSVSETISFEVGQTKELSMHPRYDCYQAARSRSCSFIDWDDEGRNTWKTLSEEWVQYPIVLVHGILGGWNPEMFGVAGETFSPVNIWGARWYNSQYFPENNQWMNLNLDQVWFRLENTLKGRLQLAEDFIIEGTDACTEAGVENCYFKYYYDWRQSNRTSGAEFADYIQYVKEKTGKPKVNIVAHSMGGLVTREYILTDTYQERQDIARLVTAGTPHQGSVESIPLWYGGNANWPETGRRVDKITYPLVRWYLGLLNEKEEGGKKTGLTDQDRRFILQKYIPSVQELLPMKEAVNVFQAHSKNNFIEKRSTFNPILTQERNEEFLSRLKDINTLFVSGRGYNTFSEIDVSQNNIFSSDLEFRMDNGEVLYAFDNIFSKEGDGTVLVEDSKWECEDCENWEYLLKDNELLFGADKSDHGNIVNISVEEILEHFNMEIPATTGVASSEIQEIDSSLVVWVASPVQFEVISPSGKVYSEEQTQEFYEENQAYYISLGDQDSKILVIGNPEDGEYAVNIQSTGEGEYGLVTNYTSNEQFIEKVVEDEISLEEEKKEYIFELQRDDEGKIEEEKVIPVPSNTPPTASLDRDTYEGVENDEIIFDGSFSTDEDGDTLQYRWIITDDEGNEIISTEFSENPSYVYTFEDPFTGTVTLTITDGEFGSSVSSQIIIRELSYQEKVSQVRGLLDALEEDTSYMKSKKRLWIQLVDLLELPQVEKSDKLKNIIIRLLDRDIERSLQIDRKLERRWFWWRRVDLISDENEEILQEVIQTLESM